jgi:hypothetical protein
MQAGILDGFLFGVTAGLPVVRRRRVTVDICWCRLVNLLIDRLVNQLVNNGQPFIPCASRVDALEHNFTREGQSRSGNLGNFRRDAQARILLRTLARRLQLHPGQSRASIAIALCNCRLTAA